MECDQLIIASMPYHSFNPLYTLRSNIITSDLDNIAKNKNVWKQSNCVIINALMGNNVSMEVIMQIFKGIRHAGQKILLTNTHLNAITEKSLKVFLFDFAS